LHLIGEIEARRGGDGLVAAERAFRESLALAVVHGMRPLQAHCHLGLGNVFTAGGDQAKALEHCGIAAAMMREMGMGIWLSRAETALTRLTASS
jgi:hypothetical protein